MDKPNKKTFAAYDLFELRDYLKASKEVSEAQWDEFWHWWIDLGDQRTGPCDGSVRFVPLGFWGWTEEKPYRQLDPETYRKQKEDRRAKTANVSREMAAHKVLCALEQFADRTGDLRVWMNW